MASLALVLLVLAVLRMSSSNEVSAPLSRVANVLLAWYGASGSKGEKWLWSKTQKFAKEAAKKGKGKHQSALSKVIAAAKAAADEETGKIRAADNALRIAQKGLGRNAVKLNLLTNSDDYSSSIESQSTQDGSDLSDGDMSSLIAESKKDKLAQPALAAAERAAQKNRDAMANAQLIIRQSEEMLGHNAAKELYSLPSLSDDGSSRPAPAARTAALARLNALARRTSLADAAGRAPAAGASWQQRMHAEREERSFLRATKFAREMP
jgi:hypothetical protein